jgi:hypothetical protein
VGIYENLSTFKDRKVVDYTEEVKVGDPSQIAYRFRCDYDDGEDRVLELLAAFLQERDVAGVEALVIGAWGEVSTGTSSQPIAEALAAARDKLIGLKYLFFGDIIGEESEISWINQSDLSPLLEAYSKLEHLTVRGGLGLSLGSLRHERLRELIIQSGGLPRSVIHEVSSADLPALEHLELWLGDGGYGGDATVEDLTQLFRADRLPRLKYLGLKNSEIADDIAAAISLAPVVEKLDTLDLSLGTLGDDGARALAASPAVKRLKLLDIHHHYVSDAGVAALKKLGIQVDASDQLEPDEWGGELHRSVSASE